MKARACIYAFGESGRGKTYLIRSLVRRAPRLLIVDVTEDYVGIGQTCTSPAAAARAFLRAGRGPCRVRLTADLSRAGIRALRGGGHSAAVQALGPAAASIAWAAQDVVLVLDELALWTTASHTPEPIALIASYGRHRRVSILGTSRRPAEVSRLLTSQADLIACFQLTEPLDLDYAARRLGREAAARLPTLAPRHALAAGNPDALRLLPGATLPPNVELVTAHPPTLRPPRAGVA